MKHKCSYEVALHVLSSALATALAFASKSSATVQFQLFQACLVLWRWLRLKPPREELRALQTKPQLHLTA